MCTYNELQHELSDKDWQQLQAQITALGREQKLKAMNAAGHAELTRLRTKV